MINSCSETQQDTNTIRTNILKDSIVLKSDSLCSRNSIKDITFYDPGNFVTKIDSETSMKFPFIFIEKNKQIHNEARKSIIKHLRYGQDMPVQQLHNDWTLLIVIIVSFLFSVIKTVSRNLLPGITRYFLFRGINDPSSRDISELFHWQSTILNLCSFLIIGLFAYKAETYYNLLPENKGGITFWIISVGVIASTVTLRHIVCIITGQISGERDVFREYVITVYQFYRFIALFLFVNIVLMSYTVLFPVRVSIMSVFIAMGLLYLIRIIRLMLIFINRNISILYFILYLCALEILPVLISLKYFSGLV
jgi:hypothetical protein